MYNTYPFVKKTRKVNYYVKHMIGQTKSKNKCETIDQQKMTNLSLARLEKKTRTSKSPHP